MSLAVQCAVAHEPPHRTGGDRQRHLVHLLQPRPLGQTRRTGLHHRLVACSRALSKLLDSSATHHPDCSRAPVSCVRTGQYRRGRCDARQRMRFDAHVPELAIRRTSLRLPAAAHRSSTEACTQHPARNTPEARTPARSHAATAWQRCVGCRRTVLRLPRGALWKARGNMRCRAGRLLENGSQSAAHPGSIVWAR